MKPAILVCGQTGTGKSSIVNFRLREPLARVGESAESVRNGFPPPKYMNDAVIFYDSDGYEIGLTDVYKNKLMGFLADMSGESGIHLVWYTINAAAKSVTDFDKKIIGLISEDFYVCILLTKIDDCDEDGLKEFYDEVNKLLVLHVIKSVLPQIIGKTAIRSGLKFIPVIGWIVGAVVCGAWNSLIAQSLGEATIDICNEYLFDKLSNCNSKRNFEDIFTSGIFACAVKKHMGN